MTGVEAFGPNLRRMRLRRGISLYELSLRTKVSVELWDAMEGNDVSKWPAGLYARAYIREYAELVGVDPDATVDEFCRLFRQGDRRAESLVRHHAELLGHPLTWSDDLPRPPVTPVSAGSGRPSRVGSGPPRMGIRSRSAAPSSVP